MSISRRITLLLSAALLIAGTLAAGGAQGFTLFGPRTADGWSAEELAVLASLRLSQLPAAPSDPSNAYENSAAAVALGQRLFDAKRLSRNQAVSCASCHDPDRQFQDGRQTGKGVGTGSRRSMPIVAAGYSPWLFWDGRKDSVWSQALGPLEDAAEHGGNRLHYARLVQQHYAQPYQTIFGPLPDLSDLPQHASPLGTDTEKAAWQAIDEARRDSVSRVFANMGKTIAAYEKTLRHEKSRLDDYLDEAVSAKPTGRPTLDAREVNGLRLFIGKAQCISCHSGPLLTDQHFHNTGVPQRDANRPDRGRAAALAKVSQDEFNCLGRYSDAQPGQCEELRFMVTQDPSLEGAFKTPGLREVALRPPYMHAGQFASLEEVVRHYVDAPDAAVGHSELGHSRQKTGGAGSHGDARQPIRLSPAEQQDLVAFLRTLSASAPAGAGRR
jgi:cytochrome c peroxidase